MVENTKMTYFERIHELIKTNKGFITGDDIKRANIPSAIFSHYIKKYRLEKHCPGFYSKKEWMKDDYFIFQYQYPKMIYSFYAAAYLNKLNDHIPTFLEVTGPKNYRPFALPKKGVILHTDTRETIYNLGVIKSETAFGNYVRVYNSEKTICDFIRNREKLDIESFVKCISWYRKSNNKDINLLFEYAYKMKIQDKVNSLMEVILNVD